MSQRLSPHSVSRQRGFTLVEMIVVMVVTGVLAGIMVLFIRQPVKSYTDAAARAELTDIADLALRRMARELHTALPNSARLSVVNGVSMLEFIPTKAGGKYLAVEDNGTGTALSFTDSAAVTFTVVGTMPAIAAQDYIVVYNLGTGFSNADAYVTPNPPSITGNRATVSIKPPSNLVTMTNNPFAVGAGSIPNTSPDHRFQVGGAPVTFRCVSSATGGGTLTRYWGYGFQAAQTDPAGLATKSQALLADHVLGCDFSVTQAAGQQAGLIGMTIALARANPGNTNAANGLETVTLTNQIHVDNTP